MSRGFDRSCLFQRAVHKFVLVIRHWGVRLYGSGYGVVSDGRPITGTGSDFGFCFYGGIDGYICPACAI